MTMETIDHKHEIYKVYSSSCTRCKNKFDNEAFTCLAFPEGIPDKILEGRDMHVVPFEGQKNDIVYSKK